MDNKVIKVNYVFQSYPVFYQPYIPPVIEALSQKAKFKLKVLVFKDALTENIIKMPSYSHRRVFEKVLGLIKPTYRGLNYMEYKAIKNRVDIVHLMDSYLHPKIYGFLSGNNLNRPKTVITLRGNDTYIKPWVQKKWQDFYKHYGNAVDAFIVMSKHQKQYLHEKWGISKLHIHIIPISYGDIEKAPSKSLTGSTLQIVSAFRMCWEKNIEGNIRVIKYLVEKGVNVHYHMYGDGPDSGQVFYLIDKYKLSKHITYHGRVDNAQLKRKLKDYDVFLQLSHSEAFPTSVLEAQSQGLPAVISDAGGMPEVIRPEVSGYCVPSYDSEGAAELISELFNNPKLYNEFSAQAINYVAEQFSIANEVDRLTKLYDTLTNAE